MIIYIHREETVKLSLETCLNASISSNEHKKYLDVLNCHIFLSDTQWHVHNPFTYPDHNYYLITTIVPTQPHP